MAGILNKKNQVAHIIYADTYLHIIYAKAIERYFLPNEKTIIIWSGNDKVEEKFPLIFENLKAEFIKVKDPAKSSFLNIKKSYLEIYEKIKHLRKYSCKIITCYDTAYTFEIVRHILRLGWNRVAILDDGIVNYIENVGMPHVSKRLVKNIINKSLGRFPINTSRYNLGGNRKIRTFFTMSPENIFIKDPSEKKIYNISNAVKNILEDGKFDFSNLDFKSIDAVISLAPIYTYQRNNKKELIEFLKGTINLYNLSHPLIKVHPRDISTCIVKDINESFSATVVISPDVPTEFLFEHLGPVKWFGSPSSAYLNRHFLYPNYKDQFLISTFGTSKQFKEGQMSCLSKILGEKLLKSEVN